MILLHTWKKQKLLLYYGYVHHVHLAKSGDAMVFLLLVAIRAWFFYAQSKIP